MVGGGGVGLLKGQVRSKLDICGMFLFRLLPYDKIPSRELKTRVQDWEQQNKDS